MHGFNCAWCVQLILCIATYIRASEDPKTRGWSDRSKTWPFLQSAAVGLITVHTWAETSGSCEGMEFKRSDHRRTDNAEGCFFFPPCLLLSVWILSVAQHCPLLLQSSLYLRLPKTRSAVHTWIRTVQKIKKKNLDNSVRKAMNERTRLSAVWKIYAWGQQKLKWDIISQFWHCNMR